MEQLELEELKMCFVEGRSVFSVFAQLYKLCLRYEDALLRHRLDEEERISELVRELGIWVEDSSETLMKSSVDNIAEIITNSVSGDSDILMFSYAFLLAVDDISFRYVCANGNSKLQICHSSEFGTVVLKNRNKRDLGKYQKRMRERSRLWPKDITSGLNHLHVIVNENIIVNELPDILRLDWSIRDSLKIGIAQATIDPVYEVHGNTGLGVKFRITDATDIRKLDRDICKYLHQAFERKVNILVFPELIFPGKLEERFIRLLNYYLRKYEHPIVVVVGYLHCSHQSSESVNMAKCFVPEVNFELGIPEYDVLCHTIKNQPVNFVSGEKGLETISADAPKIGAVEDIFTSPYNNVIESPFGRILFLICKDYLKYQDGNIIDLDLEVILVCSMTPDSTITQKFHSKASNLRDNHLVSSVICNNGFFVQASNTASKNNSFATSPIVMKIDGDTNVVEEFFGKDPENENLEIFSI
ncbi:MAG TPA: hypothetical protein VFV52_01850 [Bacilli bacterium]|nr:hypothetical protein [Bacilli bacterium]